MPEPVKVNTNCAPKNVLEAPNFVAGLSDIWKMIDTMSPADTAVCSEGPQVTFTGVSAFPTIKKTVVKDPAEELGKLGKMIEEARRDECRWLTKQFLAKMKDQGCTGYSCTGGNPLSSWSMTSKPQGCDHNICGNPKRQRDDTNTMQE